MAGACHPFALKREKGAVMSMVRIVIGGVDTHADFHVAAAIDGNGAMGDLRLRKPSRHRTPPNEKPQLSPTVWHSPPETAAVMRYLPSTHGLHGGNRMPFACAFLRVPLASSFCARRLLH